MFTLGLIIIGIIVYVSGVLPVVVYKGMNMSIVFVGNVIDNIVRPAMGRFVNLTDRIVRKKLAGKAGQDYKAVVEP